MEGSAGRPTFVGPMSQSEGLWQAEAGLREGPGGFSSDVRKPGDWPGSLKSICLYSSWFEREARQAPDQGRRRRGPNS